MYKNFPIRSLQELCLDSICDNVTFYIKWKTPKLFLHNKISESLMEKLNEKKLLSEATMPFFNSKNTMLKSVRLLNCEVNQAGLEVLKQHKITKLECSNSEIENFSISNVLDSLSEWTIANITDVNFSGCIDFDSQPTSDSLRMKIPNMKNLKNLNVSGTKLEQISLETICNGLKFLEKLDISTTSVTDLRPLIRLSDRLTSLSIRDLFEVKFFAHAILQLNKLRYLDVSISEERLEELKIENGADMSDIPLCDVLADKHSLPELRCLDISGWRNVLPATMVLDYVAAHPKLRYLGCVLNDISFDIGLQNVAPPELHIGGMRDEQQIKVGLTVYRDQSSYEKLEKLLWRLHYLTSQFPEPEPEMFDLVLSVMAAHPRQPALIEIAIDCVFNLTRNEELSKKIDSQALVRAGELLLLALERSKNWNVESSALKALSSYPILRAIKFDKYRCMTLAVNVFCWFERDITDTNITFICSVLTAYASSEEMRKLMGDNPSFMSKLLDIFRERVQPGVSDNTLKFTLDVLWNLTSETTTCTVFLEQGGADLLLNGLENFKDNSVIETRLLGLLLNMTGALKLRHSLLLDRLMEHVFLFLKSSNYGVRSLAVGIVIHLASDEYDGKWVVDSHSQEEMLREMDDAAKEWETLHDVNEMMDLVVDYPSFRSFLSLLRTHKDCQVQLWAVLYINHICTKEPEKYCSKFLDEGGHLVLHELIKRRKCDENIKKISSSILETVAEYVDR